VTARGDVVAAATVSVTDAVAVFVVLEESETFTPKVNDPELDGVPLNVPPVLRLSPAGMAVVADHA
jgi:hypothetical protein